VDEGLVFAWFIVVALCVSAAISRVKKLNTLDFKIRSLQGKAAAQVFGVVGGIIFLIGLAAYSGVLAKTEYIVGFSALTYIALSQYSPVNTAFSFLTVAYRTEFAIDDWIKVSNNAGQIKGKVKDFTMKGVRIKTFDMSECIIGCDELLHSVVENLTPTDLFRWQTTLSVSKAIPVETVETICKTKLGEHTLAEIIDEEGFKQESYLEFHDDKLDFKPNYRRISIFTYHPKWIPMPEGAEPVGYEVAYQISREFKRDIYAAMDSQQMSYLDTSFVVTK
jgi:small-conductance mechanosensitive channel